MMLPARELPLLRIELSVLWAEIVGYPSSRSEAGYHGFLQLQYNYQSRHRDWRKRCQNSDESRRCGNDHI